MLGARYGPVETWFLWYYGRESGPWNTLKKLNILIRSSHDPLACQTWNLFVTLLVWHCLS